MQSNRRVPEKIDQEQIDAEALRHLDEITGNDEKTEQLYQLARSPQLNAILKDTTSPQHQAAKALLFKIMQQSDMFFQDELTKRTAFSQAIIEDHRATANEMLSIMKTLKIEDDRIRQLFMTSDCDGNNALHLAVNAMNDALIKEILDRDKNREIYFSRNNEGLYSIALAFKNYIENRAVLPLSIINQLYFSLEKHKHQTKAAEMEVKMGHWMFNYPLWQHVLYMCAMRDNNGKITTIDLNLWDFIIQVLEKKLKVWGLDVSKELIYKYSEKYSSTPGDMLKPADAKRAVGLAGRTLNQGLTNNTIARNKKFMQLAQMAEANFSLWFIPANNSFSIDGLVTRNADSLPKNAMMALVGENLYYIQAQEGSNKSRTSKQIVYSELSDNQKARFDALKQFIKTKMQSYEIAKAPDEAVVNIIRLVPLIKTKNNNEQKLADSKTSQNLRKTGMGFVGRTPTKKVSDTNVLLEDLTPKPKKYGS